MARPATIKQNGAHVARNGKPYLAVEVDADTGATTFTPVGDDAVTLPELERSAALLGDVARRVEAKLEERRKAEAAEAEARRAATAPIELHRWRVAADGSPDMGAVPAVVASHVRSAEALGRRVWITVDGDALVLLVDREGVR